MPKGTTGNWQYRLLVVPSYIFCTKAARGGMAHQNIVERGNSLMWAEQKICIKSSIAGRYKKAETTPGLPEKIHCQFAGSRDALMAASSGLLQRGQSHGVLEMIHPFNK